MSNERPQDELDHVRATYQRYDIGRSRLWDLRNPGYARLARERDDRIIRLIATSIPMGGRVLDLGCGDGSLAETAREARLTGSWTGIDLRAGPLAEARRRYPWGTFIEGSADAVPLGGGSQDAVVASNLFSSLPSDVLARAAALEIGRLLRSGGTLVWYDMRYPSPANPEVHPITRRRLSELFPGWEAEVQTVTLLPPLARRLGATTPVLYPMLHAIPLLRSHLIGRLRRP